MENIGDNIRARRKQLKMSQEELAKRMGYSSRSTINKIELGVHDVKQSNIVKFAAVLNTTPSFLMGWTDDPLTAEDALKKIQFEHDTICSALERFGVSKEDSETVYKYLQLSIADRAVIASMIDRLFMSFDEKGGF